jgi:hypothetical protein
MGYPISLTLALLLFARTVKRTLRLVVLSVSSSYATIINMRPLPGAIGQHVLRWRSFPQNWWSVSSTSLKAPGWPNPAGRTTSNGSGSVSTSAKNSATLPHHRARALFHQRAAGGVRFVAYWIAFGWLGLEFGRTLDFLFVGPRLILPAFWYGFETV